MDFLTDDFIEKHLKMCKHSLKKNGDIQPFFLIQKSGNQGLAPIPLVNDKFRMSFWVSSICEFNPDAFVLTSTGWLKLFKRKIPKNYQYGDIKKFKGKKEVLIIWIADFKKNLVKNFIYEILRTKDDIKLVKLNERNELDSGAVSNTIRTHMNKVKDIGKYVV